MPETPVGPAEYGVGWSLCAFFMSTPTGKATLSRILADTARGDAAAAAAAVEQHWPGGIASLDREWRAWLAQSPAPIQLPIPTDPSPARGTGGAGWMRCKDGSLLHRDSGMQCGRWVAGPGGVMTFVPDG